MSRLLGLIGGMSWQSTAEYYRLLNTLAEARSGGHHSAHCLIYSVDFNDIEHMQAQGRWDDAAAVLIAAAQRLEVAGAEVILLCTNTMHKVACHIEAALSVPFLNLLDATADRIIARRLRTVGLLGTRYTMTDGFYTDHMAKRGLHVIVPDRDSREAVHRIIYEELCKGLVTTASQAVYRKVISELVGDGCEGVIFGCTEIELLMEGLEFDVPVFPTTRIHVEAAIATVDG